MQTSVSGRFPRSTDIRSEAVSPIDQVFDQDSDLRSPSLLSSSYTALSDQELHSMLNERGPVKRATVELDNIVSAQCGRTLGSLRSVASLMEIEKLEERRHWKEVSTFLRTDEPPPSNFVSIPEHGVVENPGKKSLLQIFRRQTKKKSTPMLSRNLQLPDSAVASRTTSGHRHIAISIPLSVTSSYSKDGVAASEHIETGGLERHDFATAPSHKMPLDLQVSPLFHSESTSIPKRSASNEKQLPGNHSQTRKNRNSKNSSHSSGLGVETTSALENYYRTELMFKDEILSVPPKDRAFHSEVMNPKSAVVTGYPSNPDWNKSQWTDSRGSGTTSYSEKTLESLRGHSRGSSSISTVPSTDQHQHWLHDAAPKRTSSKHKTGFIELSTLAPAPKFKQTWKQKAGENTIRSSVLSVKSIESDLSSKVAKIADTYSHGQTTSVGSSVHNAPISPTPTRPLPDLPESSHDSHSHRSRSRSHNNDIRHTAGDSGNKPKRPTGDNGRQSRQDKVKALRIRDINRSRSRSTTPKSSQTCICGATPMANSRTGMNGAPRRDISRSSLPRETRNASAANTLSPIMLVADSEPYLYFGQSDDFIDSVIPFDPRSGHYHNTYSNYRGRIFTPPLSVEPSLASSDDETLHLPRSRASTSNTSRSLAGSVRSRHRVSRSSVNGKQPSPQFQEEDITERLQKLDNSIAAILQTMTAVMEMGSSFKELNQVLLPESPLLDLPDPYQTQAHNVTAG